MANGESAKTPLSLKKMATPPLFEETEHPSAAGKFQFFSALIITKNLI